VRILYVSSDFGVPVYGHKGASVHLRAVARAFAELGHTVQIVSPAIERDANFDFDVPASASVDLAPDMPALASLRQFDRALGSAASGHPARVGQEVRCLLYNQALAGASAGLGCDFVYERYALFGFGGLELSRALGVPHVLEVNAPLATEQHRVRGLHMADVATAIENRVWRQTGAVLAVSDELAAEVRARGVAPERVHVLPNGVDAARFGFDRAAAAARVRAALGLGTGPIVGFVGSLKPWHGTDVLLEAFARLAPAHPTACLLVVGDGPAAGALRERTRGLGLEPRVRFTGAVEHARVPELVAAMDIAAAPYRAADDFYFSPIKVYEYLAAGTPVVASPLGQIAPLVAAGLVTPAAAGDAGDLARALESILQAPAAASQRAARGRDWALGERTWTANARRAIDIALAAAART
jgi:glycosyltransferase involved in cell wall biosynthesis